MNECIPICHPLPFLSVLLFLCVTSAPLNANESPPPPEKQPFYLGPLKRTQQIYVRNPVGCLIQEAEGISGGIRGTHTHTRTELCIHMGETLNTQHAYSHVQETLNRKYLHNDRYIFTHAHKHAEESLVHKTRIHAYRKHSTTNGWTHTHTYSQSL